MDVLNKIKSQVSTVLPGNPITKDFEVLNLVCSCGPCSFWKVYDARIRSSKQDASVWILEKKVFEKMSRSLKDDIINIMRKGVVNLTKLRHPKILSVVHPLEESRESLAFATEPVHCCMEKFLNPDSIVQTNTQTEKLYDIELKYGILQICEALSFLHNDCKQLHLNICPESIVMIKSGSWKLCGFEFSTSSTSLTGGTVSAKDASGDVTISVPEWQNNYSPLAQPRLNYCSPEVALQGRGLSSSDMFSLGMLLISLFNNGKPLFDAQNDVNSYRKNVNELNNIRVSQLQNVPESLREFVKLLLKSESTLRPDAQQFSKITFFNDSSVSILQNMDNLFQLDNLARSQFYKTLPKIVMSLPKRINLHRILPQLTLEFNNNNMIPFVLPTVLQISDLCSEVEFTRYVFPKLITVFSINEPIQIILIFLQNLHILMSKCPESDFKNYILPMMNRAIEADNGQTQELCLKVLPTVVHMMSFSTLKSVIFPRLKRLCHSSSTVQMKVACLICIGKLIEHTDKWFVLDDVLPVLAEIKSREPAVLMSILGIYRLAFSHKKLGITKEVLAVKAIPFLLPLAVDNNLNLSQYSEFMGLIQQMITRLDTEHRTKLEQLNGLQQEYKSLPGTDGNMKLEMKSSESAMVEDVSKVFGFQTNSDGLAPQSLVQYNTTTVDDIRQMNSTGFNLSLEDKQRLANQQENFDRLKTMQKMSVVPKSIEPSMKKSQSSNSPVDLTSTLMNRNLVLLSNSSNKASSNTAISNYSGLSSDFNNGSLSSAVFGQPSSVFGQNSSQITNQSSRAPVNTSVFDGICDFGKINNQPTLKQISNINKPSVTSTNPFPVPFNSNNTNVINSTQSSHSAFKTVDISSSKLSSCDIDDLLK